MGAATPATVVTTAREGAILVVTVDNPPVNALGVAVRQGLAAAMDAAQADDGIAGVLLVGAGKAFIAGADIREFGKPAMSPSLPEVCRSIEDCTKPVIAVLHGAALGGGLEVAMSAHYRLALPAASLGLPEVNLGLLPGSGGTQRAPRLMGVKAATELMLSGKHLGAKAALQAGLVDRLVEAGTPVAAGLAYAHELLAQKAPVRRTRDIAIANPSGALADLEALRAETAKKTRGLFSPLKIIECVQAAVQLTFDEGLARERALFLECLDSPQRAGLIHAFFAERETAKIPEAQAAQPRAFQTLAIIGGGTMGAGITVSALDAGFTVTMIERDAESIARGQKNVEKVYDGLIAKGRMTEEGKAATMARYTPSTSYDDIADVDLVIEAVFEDLEVKKAVFKELDRVCKKGAVLATNTSYLDIDAIAAATSRPQDVIGLHFFSPANIMKLLEIVVPAKVSADVVATAFELAKKLKKVPVRAGVCDGFIGNRILAVYKQAADYLMEDGASPYEIDEAVRGGCHGPVPGDRPGRWRHRLGHAQAPCRHARPQGPLRRGGRPHLRARLVRPEDRPGLLPVPARRARGPARPRSAGHCGCRAREEGCDAAPVHARGNHAPLHGRHGQRRRQGGGRGHCPAPAGCGRDLPVRLRFSALSRRPHEVGRHAGPAPGAG
jgi:3-hydroxyacyl-CoA dehydrogenase